jgi:CBS domain-containing protein
MTPSNSPLPNDALKHHRVFGLLPEAQLKTLADQAELITFAPGSLVVAQEHLHNSLALIVSGEVDLQDPDLGWSIRLSAPDWFGAGVTPAQPHVSWQAVATAPTQILFLQADDLRHACTQAPQLNAFFALPPRTDLHTDSGHPGSGTQNTAVNLLSTPIRSLIKREAITLSPTVTIREAAELMRDRRVSSVLLVEQNHLFGLITDRDLRNRVVAQGLDSGRPVADIATLAPLTLQANSPAFEALLMMARHNIHHVPVMDGQHIAGMITATDLTEQHSTSAVYLAGDIYKQTTLDGLVQISSRIKLLQQHLAAAQASAYSTGHIVTTITDALTTRLIHLAEARLGPAPIDYVWVAAGSQARSEQTAKSDQDNCLILDDSFEEALHGEYFKAFSKWVCDGLAACGYIHCPGEMMAMTDTWRQPRKVWAHYFQTWVDQPKPKALMLTCVFFDLRAIHGKAELIDSLREEVAQRTKGNSLFLAHMVSNALKHRPPLGLFGRITLIKEGEGARAIDLKHSGIVPIVDLTRVYALAAGVTVANTHDRLEVSSQAGEVSAQSARDLRDALEFLGKLRIAHQSRQMAQGKAPDNFLALEELSNFERSHLKDAFEVVQTLQEVLQQRYSGGRF